MPKREFLSHFNIYTLKGAQYMDVSMTVVIQ